MSFAFDNHNQAQISLLVFNFVTGFVATMAYVIMDSIDSTKPLAKTLRPLFLCFPPYNLGEGLLRLSAIFYTNTVLGGNTNLFAWEEGVGGPLGLMAVEAVAYVCITLLLETRFAKLLGHALDQLRTISFFRALELEKEQQQQQQQHHRHQEQQQQHQHHEQHQENEQVSTQVVEEEEDVAAEAAHTKFLLDTLRNQKERFMGAIDCQHSTTAPVVASTVRREGAASTTETPVEESTDRGSEDGGGVLTSDIGGDIGGDGSGRGTHDLRDWSEATILLDGLQKVYPPPISSAASSLMGGGKSCSGCCSCPRSFCCCRQNSREEVEVEEQQEGRGEEIGGGNGTSSTTATTTAANPSRHQSGGLKHAVKGLSLAVPRGETFGFLGINGAGKTTTLSVLTGDLFKSRGHALVNGKDVGDPNTQRSIGYCPQVMLIHERKCGMRRVVRVCVYF